MVLVRGMVVVLSGAGPGAGEGPGGPGAGPGLVGPTSGSRSWCSSWNYASSFAPGGSSS